MKIVAIVTIIVLALSSVALGQSDGSGQSEVWKNYRNGNTITVQAETERAEFSAIIFKTRYQTVKIDTPILVEMENETRLLKITLKDPKNTKFKFWAKITPLGFKRLEEAVKNGHDDMFFINSQRAYFLLRGRQYKIGEVTINIDIGNGAQFDNYRGVIEENLKTCKMEPTPNRSGHNLDMVCKPLLIEARITKIERSNLSPDLPEERDFPYLDYIDIYIEILSIK